MGGGSICEDEHSKDGHGEDGHGEEECVGERHMGKEGAARALSADLARCGPILRRVAWHTSG